MVVYSNYGIISVNLINDTVMAVMLCSLMAIGMVEVVMFLFTR